MLTNESSTGYLYHFTMALAFTLVSDLVAEFPNRVGTNDGSQGGDCVYISQVVHETQPLRAVCIIGEVFSRLGMLRLLTSPVSVGTPKVCPSTWNLASLGENRVRLADRGVTFTDQAFEFLINMQRQQDSGLVWKDAFHKVMENSFKAQHGIV